MSITAIIEKGMIKIPSDVPWASGTVVRIEPVEEQTPMLFEALKDFDGMAGDLPADLAANDCLADRVASLAGIGRGEHSDLSTNRTHLNDFGR
jgi:hypothetical protein